MIHWIRTEALPLKTLLERQAGRKAIGTEAMQESIASELLSQPMSQLRSRFKCVLPTAILNWAEAEEQKTWTVEIGVKAKDNQIYNLTAEFLGFPNEELIAQLMLFDQ